MSAHVRHSMGTYDKGTAWGHNGDESNAIISKVFRNRTGRIAQENGASLPDPGEGRAT